MIKNVQLFVTCLIDSLFPEVGVSVVSVLNQSGVMVSFPKDQTCCGQPAYNAGFHDEARQMARQTIQVFEQTEGPIVIPSGSCCAMMKHGYMEIFAEDPVWLPRAQSIAARCYELSQFLVGELGIVDNEASFTGRIAYHPSCHLLRGLGIDKYPLQLLGAVNGAEVIPLEAECCGFGGVFAIDHEEVSSEMLNRKIENVLEVDADVVVGCDVSCLMQIEGGLRKRHLRPISAHLAQILAGKGGGLR
jgi:L-lactate dehydrogenase complex protein LldE